MQLDPRQAEAVEASGIRPILAGPGSGRTRVINGKVVIPVGGGVDPSAILALTFSERAAQEMAGRTPEKTVVCPVTGTTVAAPGGAAWG